MIPQRLKVLNMKRLIDFPEWQSEQKKLTDMQLELMAVQAERQEILANQMAGRNRPGHLDSAVQELLAGGRPTMPLPEDDKLDELSFRGQVLRKAIVIQEGTLRNLQSDLSQQIADENRPHYKKLVLNVVRSAAALRDAVIAEESFRDELQRGGVKESHISPVIFYNTKYRTEYFLNEAKKAGYSLTN